VRKQIEDPDVLTLATIAGALRADCIRGGPDDPWADSPVAWICTCPSRQVGRIGEQLVVGRRVEIKFSTLWETGLRVHRQILDYSGRPLTAPEIAEEVGR
jgi:hypothetical protein